MQRVERENAAASSRKPLRHPLRLKTLHLTILVASARLEHQQWCPTQRSTFGQQQRLARKLSSTVVSASDHSAAED